MKSGKPMRKVLAIASVGGHWVQLLRLKPILDKNETVFVSTHKGCRNMVPKNVYYNTVDASRWSKFRLVLSFIHLFIIIIKERPGVIISTGAAPGLMGIVIGRILFIKTIWIDSIANVEEISVSGKIALHFASRVYTQWPELESSNINYAGSVFS